MSDREQLRRQALESGGEQAPPSRDGGWRRWVRRGLAAVAVLVLTVATLLAFLSTAPGGRLVLRWVSRSAESAVGLRLDADAVHLRVLRGEIVLEGLRLRAAGAAAAPFLTVDTSRLALRWSSLLRRLVHGEGALELPAVALRGLILDLAAPLPEFAAGPSPGGLPNLAGLEIGSLAIEEVTVRGRVPGDGETWLRSWELQGGSVTGALAGGVLSTELGARLAATIRRSGEGDARSWAGSASGALKLGPGGRVDLSRLEVAGQGLRLAAGARGDLDAPRALSGSLTLRLDPRPWWPEFAEGEGLSLDGAVELSGTRLTADLDLTSDAVAAEILAPWLTGTALAGLQLEGTRIDARTDVAVMVELRPAAATTLSPGHRADLLRGTVDATWSRGGARLATLSAAVSDPLALDPGTPLAVTFDVRLRPDGADRVALSGLLRAPAWARLAETTGEALRLEVSLRDLRRFLDGLWTPPDTLLHWLPSGSFSGGATLDGALAAPAGRGELAWTLEDEPVLRLTAQRAAAAEQGPLQLAAEIFPALAGHRRIGGTIALGRSGLPLRLHTSVAAPDVGEPLAEVARLWPRLLPGQPLPPSVLTDPSLLRWASGEASIELDSEGPWRQPFHRLAVVWRPTPEQMVEVDAEGVLSPAPPFAMPGARTELRLQRIDLAAWAAAAAEPPAVSGRTGGRVAGGVDAHGALWGEARLELADLAVGETRWLDSVSVEARLAEDQLSLERLAGVFSAGSQPLAGGRFSGRGHVDLERLAGVVDLRLERGEAPILQQLALSLRIADGAARLAATADDLPGSAEVRAPLGTLADLLPLALAPERTADLPRGPLRVSVAGATLGPWTAPFLQPEEGLTFAGELSAELEIDPATPREAKGEVRLEGLSLAAEEGSSLAAETAVVMRLSQGLLEVPAFRLRGRPGGTLFTARAQARLAPGWSRGDDLADLLTDVGGEASGSIDASLLNPLLGGGFASGSVQLAVEASNRAGELVAEVSVDAPGATLVFPIGYITRIESPRLRMTARDGVFEVQEAEFVLNRGRVTATGSGRRGEGFRLSASAEGVRYRVGFGLNLVLGAELLLSGRPGAPLELSGRGVIQRGALRRDIFLDRALLRSLATLEGASGAEASPLDTLELDLVVTTREGIHIHNNLADLRLDWGTLTISGTLGNPTVSGRIDADPGGWLEALGQLYRVDEMSIELFDDPSLEPAVEVQVTSVLDDPTLYQQRREGVWYAGMNAESPQNDLFWRERQYSSDAAMTQFTAGLATYFGSRLARILGTGSTTQFSVQPLPLYGDTSTDGRFTLTQRLGLYATFIASADTRQTEAQTYILESAEIVPKTKIQIFSSDERNQGATAQLVTPLGRRRRAGSGEPRLGRIEWQVPASVPLRKLRRGTGFHKGDPFPDGADFDIEIEVVETLRRLGFPGSQVTVTPAPRGHLTGLTIAVEPGPRVRPVFEGIKIPAGYRELIAAGYLPSEIDRGASLEAVRAETERTLRRLGHPGPHVSISEESVAGAPFDRERMLRISAQAEPAISIEQIRFDGVPAEDAALLAGEYDSQLSRIELLEGLPAADSQLLRRAANLAFPQAEITGRHLSSEGVLVVEIEPGYRQKVASWRIVGLPSAHAALAEAVSLAPGAPARHRDLAAQRQRLVGALRALGHARAEIALTTTARPESPDAVDVVFTVTPGPRFVLAGVEFEGLEHTRRSLVELLAGLEPDEPVQVRRLGEARRNLFRTTLFDSIDTRFAVQGAEPGTGDSAGSAKELPTGALATGPAPTAGPDATDDDTARPTAVTTVFELSEGPRYLVSYGGRWEQTKGASLISDFIDRNVRGLGQTFGVRAVLGESERRLRFYYGLPRTPFFSSTAEIFLEGSRDVRRLLVCAPDLESEIPACHPDPETGLVPSIERDVDVQELSARFQLTFPLGAQTQARPFLVFTRRDSKAPNLDGDSEPGPGEEDLDRILDRVLSPLLGVQIAHDTRSGRSTAGLSEGLFLGLELNGGHEALGGGLTAFEAIGDAKLFKRVGTWHHRPMVWAQRYRLGVQLTPSDESVPLLDQYLAGGEYSLRGYRTESFGPGQAQLVLNQELHLPLSTRLSGLVFVDLGNVWATVDAIRDDRKLFPSLGAGLRFSVFRLDFAVPLDRRATDSAYQLYFGFGNAF